MPNLLKSLPKEILKKEDSKFIYNVLNPLLFDKIKETDVSTTVTHTVSSLLYKDINLSGQFIPEFILPFNINSREFNVYMADGQENNKLEYFGNMDLLTELDDLKSYMFFYFGVDGYGFLYEIIKKYYFLLNDYNKNKKLMDNNYKKYIDTADVRKKKIYKSSYEYFKEKFDTLSNLKIEFELIIVESGNYNDYSVNQLVDNYAREIGNHLGLKTFDNEIVFNNSTIFSYLEDYVHYENVVKKHVYSGKNIIETHTFEVANVFELIALFSMEISSIKSKYDEYLTLIINNGNGYALDKSEHKTLKNEMFTGVILNLDSDNLTYFLNEEKNELEIYIYFQKGYRIDESTFNISINERIISASIHSLNGTINSGYTFFEYFDDTTKYYKIVIHNYLMFDLNNDPVNFEIDDITISFDVIKSIYHTPSNSQEIYLETIGFLDNFIIYKKNEISGFFEVLNVPYKIKISLDDKEDRYVRTYEFEGIDSASHNELISQSEIIIGCYEYDYFYEPKIYVDFFKHIKDEINFRYNTILPYVLIDDVMDENFEIPYYAPISMNDYSTNIHKNIIMYDGKTYKKLYDDINQLRLLNPYNESNYEYVSKISYSDYKVRNHINPALIISAVNKIPFKDNLRYLDKLQFDTERNMVIFMHQGIQKVIPLNETLKRGKNFENLSYKNGGKIFYHDKDICDEGFKFIYDGIYLKNPITNEYDLIEAIPTQQINNGVIEKEIFFDMHEMTHCFIIDSIKYKVDGLYVDTYINALNLNTKIMFVESKYGIPRYKTLNNTIVDVDFSRKILDVETPTDGSIIFDKNTLSLIYRYTETDSYTMKLVKLDKKKSKHRQVGISAFSLFYAGNVLPENSNKTFFGRENIYGSMTIPDNVYNIGKSGDNYNDVQQHDLLAEQLDLDAEDASKFNIEQEPYLMFKSSTASFKGLESYLRASLKSISQEIGVSPVYLVQRNRFISEWAKVSAVVPKSFFAESALRDLVADLMETKLLNGSYDDLIDIFKNNDYETFSIDTNNIHDILIQYIMRFLIDDYSLEELTYYLIHEVWIANNRKKIIDFINAHADDATIREVSSLILTNSYDKEQLFYIFVEELGKIEKTIIESYIPIANYSDWNLYEVNNNVKFEKPYRYEVIDISNFITMAIEWEQPLYMIRPLTEDGVFVKRDYRFLDISMITNTQITYIDAHNEYVDDIKNAMNRPFNYLNETLEVLNELSIVDGFDILTINLVIIRWVVERFLPTYMTNNDVEDVETLREVIKTELMSAEHPNFIVSYNKIKESTLLGDFGANVTDIFESISASNLVSNTTIRLNITDDVELEYLDKIKKPLEHYFDYLFYAERHDIITKVLALFTEDVIATSMLDLSFVINIKNTKGDETFNIYETMIYDIFDEFLPFHSVLDKIIFIIKIMESSSSEAVGKELAADVLDTHYIDIMLDFAEKIRIQVIDRAVFTKSWMYIPTEGMIMCGGHDEIPYDYDRKIKAAGHDIPSHMDDDESYGVDDEWYMINKDRWRQRTEDVYTPPEFAAYWWDCGMPIGEMESVADTFINEYYHIKAEIFDRNDKIESHFIDSIPTIDITQGVNENPGIDVIEDYLIRIDSTYNIKFYDMELLGHDDYGLDEAWGPSDQTSMVDMREQFKQHILHDFYDKINVVVLDSIWTDIVIIHGLYDVPGHDEFGIDDYYHQSSPDRLEQEITAGIHDKLFETLLENEIIDMTDISLVDKTLVTQIEIDYRNMKLDTILTEKYHIHINVITNQHFDTAGHFLRYAHDEFLYDEYYHNSADEQRVDNMTDVLIDDYMGVVKIDFGFKRFLPIDPYKDLIDQKFYRANLPGSDIQSSKIKDKLSADVHMLSKDMLRVGLMDLYALDLIVEDSRRIVYESIEADSFGGDIFASTVSDSLINRHIHHDFRENIIAVDKYASILSDEDILAIYGTRAANFERDELFKLALGDTIYTSIKIKQDVERSMTKIDKDYLTSIKVEEENFVEFKYMEKSLDVRFMDMLNTYMIFNNIITLTLNDNEKFIISQINKDAGDVDILEKLHYGYNYGLEIDGMIISGSDTLTQAWSNKIHKDSMVVSVTQVGNLNTDILLDYDFEERILQPHDMYGHMGYTDESLERSLDSKLTDSLIQLSVESHFDDTSVILYDGIMKDIHQLFGDYIDVVISEALHTYVSIVKKPWVLKEFDDFGHNEYPHMYNGEDDEFDVSTELRDNIRQEAYTSIYDSGALLKLYEKINVGYAYEFPFNNISVSMTDDLKIIDILTIGKDKVETPVHDIVRIEKDITDIPLNIVVNDKIWYGYKLRENWINIGTSDNLLSYYADGDSINETKEYLPTNVRDWLLIEYTFIDDKPNIRFVEKFSYYDVDTSINDYGIIALKDSLKYHEFRDINLFETGKVYISDRLIVDSETGEYIYDTHLDTDVFLKDSLNVITSDDKFGYGPGIKRKESMYVWSTNRWYINNAPTVLEIPKIIVSAKETFDLNIITDTFTDVLNVDTYERMKFGLIFKDKTHIITNDIFGIHYKWLDDRYGVNMFSHSEREMEYYNDAVDRAFDANVCDDIKIIDTHMTFGESLIILSSDQLLTNRGDTPVNLQLNHIDKFGVSLSETLDIRLLWMDDRFGVDDINFGHDDDQQEYYNDSADRSFDAIMFDDIKIIDTTLLFFDSLNIFSVDKLVYDKTKTNDISAEMEILNTRIIETLNIGLHWLDDRYSVDDINFGHDIYQQEYYNDSADRSFDAFITDEIKYTDVELSFNETIGVFTNDTIVSLNNNINKVLNDDPIVVISNDTLMYGVGIYDYVWDVKEWNKFGYEVPYEDWQGLLPQDEIPHNAPNHYDIPIEDWRGLIPHDETPHNDLEHSEQGEELSQIQTGVYDNLKCSLDYIFKESININAIERKDSFFTFHNNPTITDKFTVYSQDRLTINYHHHNILVSKILVNSVDTLKYHNEISNIDDTLSLIIQERMSYIYNFKDITTYISLNENIESGIDIIWLDDRYGVDVEPHSDGGMGFYGDGFDRSISLLSNDDIKIIDTHLLFVDNLNIMSNEQWLYNNETNLTFKDAIYIDGTDMYVCDIGVYDYVWDLKRWNTFGYDVPYEDWRGLLPQDEIPHNAPNHYDISTEDWRGLIPYDETPHNDLSHSEQGNDLSQVQTGISENLVYGFDFIFKDVINIPLSDEYGFSTWGYQSLFKDIVDVYTLNRMNSDWKPNTDSHETHIKLRHESLTVSYEFDDKIKSYKYFLFDSGISLEEINIYNKETYELLESLMKYKMYDAIYTDISENIFDSTLFKYDEELSLITDYNAKINLYKKQTDGNITKSMTFIQDKTSTNIEMFFIDGIISTVKDKLQGTDALRPNEYLD